VLLAAEGTPNVEIARLVGVSRPTVNAWRTRYAERGLAGLADEKRSRPEAVDRSAPDRHRDADAATEELGCDALVVAAVGRPFGHQPCHRRGGLEAVRGEAVEGGDVQVLYRPTAEAKVADIIGLYLAPPENAIVLCCDEKSQIQALNRTQKTLPMQPDYAEQRTHDYVRHGTTTLFAALEIATGRVTGVCKNRHRHQEFLAFLKHVARAYPNRELHLVMDNYAAHKHPNVKAWLASNPRIRVHFTPTSSSWLNLVEVWFSIIERQAIHRGSFPSVRDLMIKIRAFIDGWNDRCHPFIWTTPADQVLEKIKRKENSLTPH
jgi:transposase